MKQQKLMIAFTRDTTNKFAKLVCRNFRHCCVMFPGAENNWILVQIGTDGVRLIQINRQQIKTMKNRGWEFVKTQSHISMNDAMRPGLLTCVGFAKRATGIRDARIWTPDGLYKRLAR